MFSGFAAMRRDLEMPVRRHMAGFTSTIRRVWKSKTKIPSCDVSKSLL
jgi:hypothetical protein